MSNISNISKGMVQLDQGRLQVDVRRWGSNTELLIVRQAAAESNATPYAVPQLLLCHTKGFSRRSRITNLDQIQLAVKRGRVLHPALWKIMLLLLQT